MIRPVNDDDVSAADESYARGYVEGLSRQPEESPPRRVPWWALAVIVSAVVLVGVFAAWLSMARADTEPSTDVDQRQDQGVDQDVVVPKSEPEPTEAPTPEETVEPAPEQDVLPPVGLESQQPPLGREYVVPGPVVTIEVPVPIEAPVPVETPAPAEPAPSQPQPVPQDVLLPEPTPEPTQDERPRPVRDLLCSLLNCG